MFDDCATPSKLRRLSCMRLCLRWRRCLATAVPCSACDWNVASSAERVCSYRKLTCKGKNIFNIRSYPKLWSNKIFRQNKMFYVPTYPIFGVSVIGNTHIILFGLMRNLCSYWLIYAFGCPKISNFQFSVPTITENTQPYIVVCAMWQDVQMTTWIKKTG